MSQIPQKRGFDSTLSFLNNPYRFISQNSKKLNTSLFKARVMLQDTIFLIGRDAAHIFYDSEHFVRENAMPSAIQHTLIGTSGVQGLDDDEHRHRKQMFMLMMTPARVDTLKTIVEEYWCDYAYKWEKRDEVILYDELREMLCQAIFRWVGLPLEQSDVEKHTKELTALFGDAGSVSIKHFGARLARKRAERWAGDYIDRIRAHKENISQESPAAVIAFHRDLQGELLDRQVAAVELLNILRPVVAVSVFITFTAHALHAHPETHAQLDDSNYLSSFVQEVRRFYPFFPAVVARVRQDFEYKGCPFHKGTRAVLDLYGTNHDAETWVSPDQFHPERFLNWDEDLFGFIPQGGGDPFTTHRCPGETIAVELMKSAALFLTRRIRYEVPSQDLSLDYTSLPALPRSHFVMRNVQVQF
ncbi:MAG: cytochrome P450 [Aggregatilineales bacterium]